MIITVRCTAHECPLCALSCSSYIYIYTPTYIGRLLPYSLRSLSRGRRLQHSAITMHIPCVISPILDRLHFPSFRIRDRIYVVYTKVRVHTRRIPTRCIRLRCARLVYISTKFHRAFSRPYAK